MSLESEYGKELALSLKKNKERLREFLLRTDNGRDGTTGTRGVLRGPRGPKNMRFHFRLAPNPFPRAGTQPVNEAAGRHRQVISNKIYKT